jgi:hypothetical protein
MILSKNPYIYRTIELEFLAASPRAHRTLATAMCHQFTIVHHNWSQEEDKDITAKLPIVFLEPVDPHIEPPPSPEPGGATTAVRQAVCCPRWAPRDPLSILPLSLSCLVHRSTLAVVLRWATHPYNGATGSLSRHH